MEPFGDEATMRAMMVGTSTSLEEVEQRLELHGEDLDAAMRSLAANWDLDATGPVAEVFERFRQKWNEPLPPGLFDQMMAEQDITAVGGSEVFPQWGADDATVMQTAQTLVAQLESTVPADRRDLFEQWAVSDETVDGVAAAFGIDPVVADVEIRLLAAQYGLPTEGDLGTVRANIRMLVNDMAVLAQQHLAEPVAQPHNVNVTTVNANLNLDLPSRRGGNFRQAVANLVLTHDNATLDALLSAEDKRKMYGLSLDLGQNLGSFGPVCDYLRGEAVANRL